MPDTASGAALRARGDDEIETVDVEAVNARGRRKLYEKRRKIYPKKADGRFRRLKWLVMAVTLAIYYIAPWIRWDRGPAMPDQAILIDLPARRFYFFFIEIWPDEVYFITGLLIVAALALFLFTSLFGRVWCGYACPQTVWTDLFIAVERWIEGERNQRIRLDAAPWSIGKLTRKSAKHAIWLAIAIATGGAWVFYYADAPTLAGQLVRFEAPTVAYGFIALFAFTTYTLGGIAREQVCTYMCPWPRIQAALQDEESLVVSYHPVRGEPRGPHKKGESWIGHGACVDCKQCVAVCPMGIDIRDGQQLECISCALCIDACDSVMDKIGQPRGLIAYATLAGLAHEPTAAKPELRLVRPRTLVYGIAIAVASGVMAFALATRDLVEIAVDHDRNPLFVMLSDGSIRNAYTFKIANKNHTERSYRLSVEHLRDAAIAVSEGGSDADPVVTVPPDQLRTFRVLVTVPGGTLRDHERHLRFVATDVADGSTAEHESVFRGPK
ncbi:MAG: cytochrome c oxidase accessory protein CcoG [Gemmatimonas sp.]